MSPIRKSSMRRLYWLILVANGNPDPIQIFFPFFRLPFHSGNRPAYLGLESTACLGFHSTHDFRSVSGLFIVILICNSFELLVGFLACI